MYSDSSTRQIFNKLAHSSIMKINESSMDKLYDLMTMGVKYQWIRCSVPQQMLQYTFNHMAALNDIAKGSDVSPLIVDCCELLKTTYCSMSIGNWYQLHQQVAKFFEGRKVKISMFLQNKIQHMDGTITIDTSGPVGYGSEPPGRITYFESGKLSKSSLFAPVGIGSDYPTVANEETYFDLNCFIGSNMYLKAGEEGLHSLFKEFWTRKPLAAE